MVEGQGLHLDASASHDVDNDPLTYSWDLNGDGVFGDATGVAPTLTWAQLEGASVNDGPAVLHPTVRVSDGKVGGTTVSAPTTLTVVNAPPVAFIGGAPTAAKGLVATFALSSTDPSVIDQQAGFDYEVSWGDGTAATLHGPGAVLQPHAFPRAGQLHRHPARHRQGRRRQRAGDQDGDRRRAGALTCAAQTGPTLIVGGTSGADTIVVGPGTTAASVAVTVNGVTLAGAGHRVRLDRGAGRCRQRHRDGERAGHRTPLRVRRGAATTRCPAGTVRPCWSAATATTPSPVARRATSSSADSARTPLVGGGGDDLLIPGATSFDPPTASGQQAFCAIAAEWTRTDAGFGERVLHLLGVGHGLNGGTRFVLAGRARNVGRRSCGDTVDGGPGIDWYLEGLGR